MDIWISKNNLIKQITLSVACTVLGLALMIGLFDYRESGSNVTAGFLLGALLLTIGFVGGLMSSKQTVIVDSGLRCITIEDLNLFRSKKRSISFSDVVSISIGYLGKKSNYVTCYYLILQLRSGEEYPLFSPGHFFEGGSDRFTVVAWKQRLEEYLSR